MHSKDSTVLDEHESETDYPTIDRSSEGQKEQDLGENLSQNLN